MHEPLMERISVLERAVQRWKLVSVALLILLLCSMAISGTFGVVLMFARSGVREVEIMRMEAEMARNEAVRAQAERARMDAELARQRAEQQNKKGDDKGPNDIDP